MGTIARNTPSTRYVSFKHRGESACAVCRTEWNSMADDWYLTGVELANKIHADEERLRNPRVSYKIFGVFAAVIGLVVIALSYKS